MNSARIVAGLALLGAALCLGAIWPMWARVLASNQNAPPNVDGPTYALMGALYASCVLVVGAGGLVAVAIRRLRRK